ncbi:GntR family transcriptional regulator [Bariatricus massiliensis]|uniref:GntR family transcriptional regulator n=1 Tax=Bariatricus massiliensis TaxID=1745713 RepID=A0ABS8DHP9_9FIRM|nr:GntR family transcriptional regulator [Bariatricus massiliensis]MCB7304199.1 GntR family transcriptional regulator [Bariatricus massiliensis]MCB7374370.1 GntR family transcriptional regulator [Bariatricus massiliensis]MCB7387309.1 GntR family transcriptional regulator [Bariatricus massiliensis]MCB7411471.1 GntR family transcriptional regulator [Bariatricus massiliensis]MCQ5252583.1 GntR family transcriptional regulator [Bariatricus massiliensis]
MKQNYTWEMITDILIKEFGQELYKKGEKMPSENKMAIRFGVTRSEIRKAYERLKELGYVYSMQGYGSFFSGKREKIRLFMNNESFSRKMATLNLPLETHNLGCRKVQNDSLIHSMLGVDLTQDVYKITRLRVLDKEPIAIHVSYLSEDLFPCIAEDGTEITSLYDYMHNCGYIHLHSENAQLTVSSLTKKERTLLDIKGYAPSLVLTSRCLSQPAGTVLEIARTVYRSDKFIFEL